MSLWQKRNQEDGIGAFLTTEYTESTETEETGENQVGQAIMAVRASNGSGLHF